MESNEIIRDLFINFVGSGEMPRKSYLLRDKVEDIAKELKRKNNKKNKNKIEKLCNYYEEINSIETEQAFIRGFSFAVQLLSEAFGNK